MKKNEKLLIALSALGVGAVLGGSLFHVKKQSETYIFTCPHCGKKFSLDFKEILLSPHIFNKVKAVCPKCGRYDYCEGKAYIEKEKSNIFDFCNIDNVYNEIADELRSAGFNDNSDEEKAEKIVEMVNVFRQEAEKKSEELKEKCKEIKIDDVEEKAVEVAEEVKENVEETLEKVEEKASEVVEEVKEVVEEKVVEPVKEEVQKPKRKYTKKTEKKEKKETPSEEKPKKATKKAKKVEIEGE